MKNFRVTHDMHNVYRQMTRAFYHDYGIEIDIKVRYKETTLSHMSYRKLAKFRKYAKRRALMLAMIGIHHRMNNKQKKREDD